jgi:hypothetical protein
MGYYSTAAQVIPVLMLVVLIGESRYFKAECIDGPWLLMALFAMFVLLIGELAALRTLGRGHDSGLLWAGTTVGLAYGLVFVFQSAVRTLLLEDLAQVSSKRRRGLSRLTMGVALLSILVIAVILFPSR